MSVLNNRSLMGSNVYTQEVVKGGRMNDTFLKLNPLKQVWTITEAEKHALKFHIRSINGESYTCCLSSISHVVQVCMCYWTLTILKLFIWIWLLCDFHLSLRFFETQKTSCYQLIVYHKQRCIIERLLGHTCIFVNTLHIKSCAWARTIRSFF